MQKLLSETRIFSAFIGGIKALAMEELPVNEDTDSVLCQNDIRLAIQRAEIFAACA